MDFRVLYQEIENLKKETEKVFIYGFGSYGHNLFQILKRQGIHIDGFVTSGEPGDGMSHEISIYRVDHFFNHNVGYVLALNAKNKAEVLSYLAANNVPNQLIVDAGAYLEQFGEKRGTHTGSVEITTIIGCRVNCKYCPQELLIQKYFKRNSLRASKMTIDTFKKCLDFFPRNYDISFGGMSEPFLNENFVDMLEIACHQGRHISLYTTLVGARKCDIDAILELPLQFVVLHVADQFGFAHIPLTEEYYRNLKKFINATKPNGTPFVNMCNAQAEPDKRVRSICANKYEILTEMTDRAGNLDGLQLIQNHSIKGKLHCGNLGDQMNNNIVLPDGSVVLCCMDYGLKHILGNIFENSFEEIMSGDEMMRVKAGMAGDESIDILCRNCSYARTL